VRFAELFESAANRSEVVCTFLALLELIRLKQLVCVQPEPFAEIEISRAEQIVSPAKTPAATEPTAAVENNPQSPIPNP
jgi:segregation and condensation protein A